MGGKTNRRVLEFQSDRIESALARHQVRVRVTGGTVSPRWVRFNVLPALGARVSKVKGLAEELALALDVDACRITRQGGLLSVEIPRDDPQVVRLLPLQRRLGEIPSGTALLGLGEDGLPLLVRLPSPQVAHLLVAGTTGSGKSALLRTIVASLAMRHRPDALSFVLIDPKRREFAPLDSAPHLIEHVIDEAGHATDTLRRLVALMERRDAEGVSEPYIVTVIDELVDLLMVDPAIEQPLQRLAQRGRSAGIHLVAATQKPSSAVIGSLTKANFPVRLVGRVTSPEDAKVASGYAGTGAEHLRGPGDFVAVSGGDLIRFQAAYVSPSEMAETMERVGGRRTVIALPEISRTEPTDEELRERMGRARPVWEASLDGDGNLTYGSHKDVCRAIFGDDATDAGHQFRETDRVIRALEDEAPATTTHPRRLLLRCKLTGGVFEKVVVGYRRQGGWSIDESRSV